MKLLNKMITCVIVVMLYLVSCTQTSQNIDQPKPDPVDVVNGSQGTYDDRIVVDWQSSAETEPDSITVYRATSAQGTFAVLETIAGEGISAFSDRNVEPNLAYYYQISVWSGGVESEKSVPVQGYSVECGGGSDAVPYNVGLYKVDDSMLIVWEYNDIPPYFYIVNTYRDTLSVPEYADSLAPLMELLSAPVHVLDGVVFVEVIAVLPTGQQVASKKTEIAMEEALAELLP